MGTFDDFHEAEKPRKEFLPAPEGTQNAVCVDEIDLGLQERTVSVMMEGQKVKVKKLVPITEIRWQIEERMPPDDSGEQKRFLVIARYNKSRYYDPSKKQGSRLAKDLMSWVGRRGGLDVDEKEKRIIFPPDFSLVGRPALLTIVHNQVGERTYANVTSVSPLMKGTPALKPEGYTRVKDRDKTPDQLKDEEVPF